MGADAYSVDFAEAAIDGTVTIFLRGEPLAQGDTVELQDDEGNICPGTVVKLAEHVAYVRPLLDEMTAWCGHCAPGRHERPQRRA